MDFLAAIPWAPAAAAFIFGLACGWLIWGGRAKFLRARPAASAEGETAPADPRIAKLESELAAARSLLGEKEEEQSDIDGQISSLDEAVKRANGRLKLLISSVKKAALRD